MDGELTPVRRSAPASISADALTPVPRRGPHLLIDNGGVLDLCGGVGACRACDEGHPGTEEVRAWIRPREDR